MKYYMVAGERSGDLHASNLLQALVRKDPSMKVRAIGGDKMQQAGAELFIHYRELSVMGLVEVLLSLRKILRYLSLCQQDILEFSPDVLILVDYPGFNLKLAKWAKKNRIRVFYYISPKIWAWNSGRAKIIKANVERMFSILPFEKEFYARYGFEIEYIGNPVSDAVYAFHPDPDFMPELNAQHKKVVALLPGSRKQELKYALPVMKQVVEASPDYLFVMAAIHDLDDSFYAPFLHLENVKVVFEDTYNILSIADAAVVTSGTATLETALFEVPQVVIYKTSSLNYMIGKRLVKVPFISLVNLIAENQVVKELIQQEMTVDAILQELTSIVTPSAEREKMLAGYAHIKLVLGKDNTAEKAAQLMVEYLQDE